MLYVRAVWTTDQLVVSFNPGILDRPLSKSRLSLWVVKAIQQAYASVGAPLPSGVWAHSPRGVATTGPCEGAPSSLQFVRWCSATTFTWFYRLNVAASPSFGEWVLGAHQR